MFNASLTVDTFTRMFQYKTINVLYLNEMRFVFEKISTPACSFCKSKDETPIHLFFNCIVFQNIWKQLYSPSRHKLIIQNLTRQSSIVGFLESNHKSEMLINLLLIFH